MARIKEQPPKKKFFRVPTAAQIKNNSNVTEKEDFWKYLEFLGLDDSILSPSPLKYEKFYPPEYSPKKYMDMPPNAFLKKGPKIIIQINEKERPYQQRDKAIKLEKAGGPLIYSGIIYHAMGGPDLIPREIRAISSLEGERIYAYAPLAAKRTPPHAAIIITKAYHDSSGSQYHGATIKLKVPSRTLGKGNYKIQYKHVPILENEHRFTLISRMKSNHDCEYKDNLIYFPNTPDIIPGEIPDEHENAAMLAIIAYYNKPELFGGTAEKRTLIPAEMNLQGIPNHRAKKFYDNALHRWLIKDENEIRRPLEGEIEAAFWLWTTDKEMWPGNKENDNPFYSDPKEKVQDFKWTTFDKYIK